MPRTVGAGLVAFTLIAFGAVAVGPTQAANLTAPAAGKGNSAADPVNLKLAQATLIAGGGKNKFATTTLLETLAGSKANTYVAQLIRQFGAPAVKRSIVIFDFVVADALRLIKQRQLVLPPQADPPDGRALAADLYNAGTGGPGHLFGVERVLNRLLSRSLSVRILNDVDARFGTADAFMFRRQLSIVADKLGAADSR